MSRKPRSLPVVAPASRAAFDCTACGTCCYSWTVPCHCATVERLGREFADLTPYLTPREHPTALDAATLNRVDGHCVFLDEDRLCSLHKRFGPEIKPVACRSFPSKAANIVGGGALPRPELRLSRHD